MLAKELSTKISANECEEESMQLVHAYEFWVKSGRPSKSLIKKETE